MKMNDLTAFRKKLAKRRQMLAVHFSRMGEASRPNASGDLSIMPYHMADIATDNFDRELALEMMENQGKELRAIDEALARIEEGTYGVCEACGKSIALARLKVMPYASLCIRCQMIEEGPVRANNAFSPGLRERHTA